VAGRATKAAKASTRASNTKKGSSKKGRKK
jgi:hypothetical protein